MQILSLEIESYFEILVFEITRVYSVFKHLKF